MADRVGVLLLKIVLLIFNALLLILGLASVIVGCVSLDVPSEIFHVSIPMSPVLCICIGGFTLGVAIVHCFVAVRENRLLLTALAICLLVLFGLQVYWIVSVFTLDEMDLHNIMRSALKDESNPAWDSLQRQVRCCGVDAPTDWIKNKVPAACEAVCGSELHDCSGCFCKVTGYIHFALAIAVTTAPLQLFSAIVLILFACCIRSGYESFP